MESVVMTNGYGGFFRNKRVLVTGHTGFKGSWLSVWLHELGADVTGYALDPLTEKDHFVLSGIGNKITDIRGDIRDRKRLQEVIQKQRPEIIFHLAAQPLVRYSYEFPVETYETNVMGTIHLMEAMRACPETKVAVLVTTDKCYENREQLWGYRETDPMGGYDPYSSSKGACEIAISSWRRSFMNPLHYKKHGKSIASARAGNVIGGGDWAADRIIPDCIRALERREKIVIRSPRAIRPWQHVLEPLSGYLLLARKLYENPTEYCEAWNFGPDVESVTTVWQVAEKLIAQYGAGELQDGSDPLALHEAQLLALDTTKSRFRLAWMPAMNLDQTIALTADWYKNYHREDGYTLCLRQIRQYLNYGKNTDRL